MTSLALAIFGGALALSFAIYVGLSYVAESIMMAAKRIEMAIYELRYKNGGKS